MAKNWRRAGMFVAGLLLGVGGGAAILAFVDRAGKDGEPAAPVARKAGPAAGPDTRVAGAGAAPAAAATVPDVNCAALSPIVPSAGSDDGKVSLQQGLSAPVVLSMLTSGKELAASGRARDAEATFLMACRGAQEVKPADPMLVADAQYQLGRHYALLAQPQLRRSGEMLDRAAMLYNASLRTYRVRHGEEHERTRFAEGGLAAVRQKAEAMGHTLTVRPPAAWARAPQDAPPAATAASSPPQATAAPAQPAAPQAKAAPPQPAPRARVEPPPQPAQQARVEPQPQAKAAPAPQPAPQAKAAPQAQPAPQAEARQQARAVPPAPPAPAPAVTAAAEPRPAPRAEARAPAAPAPQAPAVQAPVVRTPAAQPPAAQPPIAQRPAEQRPHARTQPRQAEPAVTARTQPRQPAPASGTTTARTQPSFDCAKARSPAEKAICANEDLSRADRELGRLHARAKAASPDPRAFQRRSDEIWREREANCTTPECLRQWYARRRAELQAAETAATQAAEATQPRAERRARPRPAPEPEVEIIREGAPAQASGQAYGATAD